MPYTRNACQSMTIEYHAMHPKSNVHDVPFVNFLWLTDTNGYLELLPNFPQRQHTMALSGPESPTPIQHGMQFHYTACNKKKRYCHANMLPITRGGVPASLNCSYHCPMTRPRRPSPSFPPAPGTFTQLCYLQQHLFQHDYKLLTFASCRTMALLHH